MKKTYDEAEKTNCFKTDCTNEIDGLDAYEPRLYNENEVKRVAEEAAQKAVNQIMNSFRLMAGLQLDNSIQAPINKTVLSFTSFRILVYISLVMMLCTYLLPWNADKSSKFCARQCSTLWEKALHAAP